ncbi:MAG TPA: DUF5660 domain-containing protein [Candidatus Woesebacteria bacterium]|nr:DUF5660 domain-containing protein [Candidatus Woesebacteria bacterium]HOG37629.1 DUF5660 domain-containing protein [Candidatus Woesebacteria bacterium]
MAGGLIFKPSSKSKNLVKKNTSEILKDFPDNQAPVQKKSGILFPGQSIRLNSSESKPSQINWSHEFLTKPITQEQSLFVNQRLQETNTAVEELRREIKSLIKSTDNLQAEITNTVDQNIVEASQYQVNFLTRIKNLIINFRQNIDQSCLWLESFNRKKNRKNAFWGTVKNKKSGGEQYLLSGEHSVSRSAN